MGTLVAWVRALIARLVGGVGPRRLLAAESRSAWLLAAVLLSVVALLWPLPALALDALIVLNLGLAGVLCALAASAGEPLRLPQLPTLLLVSVLLRLGTNVAALRLILGGGDAGWLVRSGGDLLLGGDALIGAVLIAAIGAVEYLVLARGGERVAEVAARFVLDALPGRQAAIEADLRSGAIDQGVAQERRAALDREAQVYGALDGALRLVKGDVVAALLLLGAGVFGGLLVGVLRQGLGVGEAAERYALLVVGQGLLSQVPVLLNTAAAGLLLTRGAGGGQKGPAAGQAAVRVEASRALGLDAAALQTVRESLRVRLGFVMPALELGPEAAAPLGRRLQIRLYGAPLYAAELTAEQDARAVLLDGLLRGAADLLTLDAVQQTLDALQRQQPALVRETVPRRIDLGRLTALLRRLLEQRVWPLDVRAVLETVATLPKLESELDALAEQVRGGLGRFLIQGMLRGGEGPGAASAQEGLPALLLASEIEELLREARRGRAATDGALFLEPELARDIVQGVQAAKKLAPEAVLLCHADVRRSVEQLLVGNPETLPVLAYSEVPPSVPVVVMGRVEPGPGSGAERAVPFVDSAAVPWQLRSTPSSSATGRSGQ